MKIPDDAEIPDRKLTGYLLVYKARNDKSKFLAQAGFTDQNPEALREAIQILVASVEAVENRTDEYGTFYQATGKLVGVNGISLFVTTIWLQRESDGKFQFVTLKPSKEVSSDA